VVLGNYQGVPAIFGGSAGAISSLKLLNTGLTTARINGTVVTTLDDGSGNMIVGGKETINAGSNAIALTVNSTLNAGSGYVQMFNPNVPNGSNYSVLFGLTGARAGSLSYNVSATGTTDSVSLSAFTGTGITISGSSAVSTIHNTMDDSLGNMIVSGSLTLSQVSSTTGLVSSQPSGVFLDASNLNINFKSTATSSNGWNIFSTAGTGLLTVLNNTVSGGSKISTPHVIVDDGSGNMFIGQGVSSSVHGMCGTVSNTIIFNNVGVNPPTLTTRSAGTKLVMFPQLSGTTTDYALGIANNTLWSSVPTNATQFQWFGGTGSAMILSGAGALSTTTASGASRNTMDDGSGNMTVSGQINATGGLSVGGNSTTFGNFAVNLGGSSSLNAYIQATTGGGAVSRLNINPVGGSVHTQNTIVDDGSGNMTVGSLYATGSGTAPPSGVYAHIGVATLSNPGTTGGFLTAQNGGTFLPIQIGGAAYTPHTTIDDGSGNLTMQSGTTLQSGSVTRLGFTSNSNNAGQLVFTSNGATGSPFCSTLINSIGGATIFQAPMVFQWSQNGSNQHFQANFIITPNPTSTIPFSASSLTGVGGFSFYNDANMGVNGTLFLGNSANSATTFPVFQTIQANGAGTSIAFSGGLTTALNTLDDGSGRMSLGNQLSVQPGVTGSAVSLTTTSGNNMTFQVSTNQQLQFVGQGTTGCFLQSTGNTATNAQPLWLNATGGALRSRLNVLDDSSGNMTINGTFALSGAGTVSSALATYLQPTLSTGNLNDIQLGVNLVNNNTGVLAFNYVGSGSTSNSVGLSMRGATSSLSVNGSGKVTTPAGSVIDDGNGNMTISVTGTGSTPGALQVLTPSLANSGFTQISVGHDTSTGLNAGQLQFSYVGTGSTGNGVKLQLVNSSNFVQVLGSGVVGTHNQILDDGSGNATINAQSQTGAFNVLNINGNSNTCINFGHDLVNVFSYSTLKHSFIGSGGVNANNASLQVFGTSAPGLVLNGLNVLTSAHNTMDDGSGNMSVVGTGSFTQLSVFGGAVVSNGGLAVNNGGIQIGHGGGATSQLKLIDNGSGNPATIQPAFNLPSPIVLTLPGTTGTLVVNGTGQTTLSTKNVVVDDGNGNMTIVSGSTATSNLFVNNTFSPPSGGTTNTVLATFQSQIAGGSFGLGTSEIQLISSSPVFGMYMRGGFQQNNGVVAQMGLMNSGSHVNPFMTIGTSNSSVPVFPLGIQVAQTGTFLGNLILSNNTLVNSTGQNLTLPVPPTPNGNNLSYNSIMVASFTSISTSSLVMTGTANSTGFTISGTTGISVPGVSGTLFSVSLSVNLQVNALSLGTLSMSGSTITVIGAIPCSVYNGSASAQTLTFTLNAVVQVGGGNVMTFTVNNQIVTASGATGMVVVRLLAT
jgi:hypothetical protein